MDAELARLVQEQFAQIGALRDRLDAIEQICVSMAERLGLTTSEPVSAIATPYRDTPSQPNEAPSQLLSGETADLTDDGSRDAGTGTLGLKDALVTVLAHAGKPMSFEDIFATIQRESPESLPNDKPKLHVRRLLYRRDLFTLRHGFFLLRSTSATATELIPAADAEPETPISRERSPDETLILDSGAMLVQRSATGKNEATAEPAPADAEIAPAPRPPRARLPRQDHFTSRLEAILGTDTRFRVPTKESEPFGQE